MKRAACLCGIFAALFLLFGYSGCRMPFCPSTEEPYVIIDQPPLTDVLPPTIVFSWHSGLEVDPRGTRYIWGLIVDTNGVYNPSFDIVRDLNENPWRYEEKWSRWYPYAAGNDSGRTTVIGDDESLTVGSFHFFAVQAIDRCGMVTETFTNRVNVRKFIVSATLAPILSVLEPFLGFCTFVGTGMNAQHADLPPGIPLNFRWKGDAGAYGGEIVGYRYGWDIADLAEPDQWATELDPLNVEAPETIFHSGVHTFFVEAVDNFGLSTLASIQITIVPFPMDRELLWVDDFYSEDFVQTNYVMPTETEHDAFWLDICSRAVGFDPGTDVYDTGAMNFRPPTLADLGRYKNIIWTYSSQPTLGTFDDIVRFTPESWATIGTKFKPNPLPLFLAKGGHLWTLGRSDRAGGLAAVLYPVAQVFPMSLECEITGLEGGCSGDMSGVYSMAYKDYCVSMLDKIVGVIRTDWDMPFRLVTKYDALIYAYRADDDPITAAYPGLPGKLDMWSVATAPGTYFDPTSDTGPGGLTYVEIYDPEYWMNYRMISNQECFHPMFRMRSYNVLSALNNTTIALWLTEYDDVVPEPEAGIGVPAKSIHFGFPLWFFERDDVDQIVDVVFTEWQIMETR